MVGSQAERHIGLCAERHTRMRVSELGRSLINDEYIETYAVQWLDPTRYVRGRDDLL